MNWRIYMDEECQVILSVSECSIRAASSDIESQNRKRTPQKSIFKQLKYAPICRRCGCSGEGEKGEKKLLSSGHGQWG
jgi:hypothetical protein